MLGLWKRNGTVRFYCESDVFAPNSFALPRENSSIVLCCAVACSTVETSNLQKRKDDHAKINHNV